MQAQQKFIQISQENSEHKFGNTTNTQTMKAKAITQKLQVNTRTTNDGQEFSGDIPAQEALYIRIVVQQRDPLIFQDQK